MTDKKDLLDPKQNDLIPDDDREEEEPPELSPDGEPETEIPELSPGGEAVEEPPELSPDYEDRPRPAPKSDWITDELARTKADPCDFGCGLSLYRLAEGAGLHVYKLGVIVRDIMDLNIDDLRTIKGYLERSR